MITTHPKERQLLARSLSRDKVSHAYLFSGPEGAGKRTLALEFAASLVCETRSFPPCAECSACRRVSSKTHPDVSMVEAATRNILISQILELRSGLHYMSFEGGYKVGIVPEAERMNSHAQNAFLKTLEEPPSETVLILTTTNLSRLLPTIISRCQLLRLGPLPETVIEDLLTNVAGLDQEQARLMATLAQGNATRALDMDMEFVLGFRKDMISRLLELDCEDRISMLDFAEDLSRVSHPIETVLDLLSSFYRDVLHLKLGRNRIMNTDLIKDVTRQAKRTSTKRILGQLEIIHMARGRAAGNANPRINWEILTMALKGVQGTELKIT